MSTFEPQIGRIAEGVEVRIRADVEADSVYLCNVPFTALEALVTMLGKWGVMSLDGNVYTSTSGQFVIETTGAFFEVIVHTEDA